MTLRDQLARFHAAVIGATPLDDVRDLVERGEIDPRDRMRVYEYAYVSRIAGVLVHDYPKLAKLVGEDRLRSWTANYLRAHPPSNFSLREVGANLAAWLASEGRAHVGVDAASVHALLGDLARLERARIEVFDGPDATPLSRDDLASMDPAEFPSLRMQLVPSSRVVSMTSRADEAWDAIENEAPDDGNGVGPHLLRELRINGVGPLFRRVLVWRRELTVIHRTLDADEARIVPMMIEGTTFGAACELLEEATAAERAIELLIRWLDGGILRRA